MQGTVDDAISEGEPSGKGWERMALELTKNTARTTPVPQLLENIDDWVDFLIENRREVNFDKTLGFLEMTINFPDFPWVHGVSVHADPWEHDDVWSDYSGDEHEYMLDKAKAKLRSKEINRLRQAAEGPLTPMDWLTYADGEPGSED